MFKTLIFSRPDIILCLNGELPEHGIFECLRGIPIAAADGAANKLREKGILPEYIIGDLDSIAEEWEYWEQQGVFIKKVEDQNATDFEKTLDFVIQQGFSSILIVGFHGGDLDHTLNNWSILIRYARLQIHLTVFDKGKIALPISDSLQFTTKTNEMISLIPAPEVRVTTEGLKWNLKNEALELGTREGARNRALEKEISLVIHSGSLFLFLRANLPLMPKVIVN